MEERKWKLGDDLHETDSLFDGLTFEELIMTVRCNCQYVNPEAVKKEAQRILDIHKQDFDELMKRNMDAIIERVIGDKPLDMSFYKGTINKALAIKRVMETDKQLVYTLGYEYRHPTTHRVPIDKVKAVQLIQGIGYLDIKEEETCIHLNEFSDNDMW